MEGIVARFLISTQPMISHDVTAKPVARELVARGHEVRWHAGRRLEAAVEETGAVFVPIRSALDYDGEDLNGAFPERRNLVTNGGFGGISSALAHGVPLVGAGDSQEKPEVLARLAWSGAGINLKTANPTPNQVGAAVRRVLDTPSYRENARRIQSNLAQHDAPREAAELLEQLAAGSPPATRGG